MDRGDPVIGICQSHCHQFLVVNHYDLQTDDRAYALWTLVTSYVLVRSWSTWSPIDIFVDGMDGSPRAALRCSLPALPPGTRLV